MEIETAGGPGSSVARVTLRPGESCVAEGGAMISMVGDVGITTSTYQRSGGGVLAGMRRVLAGESFFLNRFTAGRGEGTVLLAPTLPGDLTVINMSGGGVVAESGSVLCCTDSVTMELGWQGFKSLLSGEGLFWVSLKGSGPVVLNGFGAIYSLPVDGEYVVDTGHIVAFEESLTFSISKAGGSWVSSFLGGEGLVCRFKGQGRIWCQSHNPAAFGRLMRPLLRPREASTAE